MARPRSVRARAGPAAGLRQGTSLLGAEPSREGREEAVDRDEAADPRRRQQGRQTQAEAPERAGAGAHGRAPRTEAPPSGRRKSLLAKAQVEGAGEARGTARGEAADRPPGQAQAALGRGGGGLGVRGAEQLELLQVVAGPEMAEPGQRRDDEETAGQGEPEAAVPP